MNSTQSDSKVDSKGTGTSFLNFIVEVQWYVCLKEQIYQQIVSSDVRPTVRDVKTNGENSQAVQNKEVSLMPNAVIEPETYISLSDNAVALPSFASTVSRNSFMAIFYFKIPYGCSSGIEQVSHQ